MKPLNFVQIWCGNFQTFALDNKNNLYSWGLNDVSFSIKIFQYYQLGNQKCETYLFQNKEKKGEYVNTFSVLYDSSPILLLGKKNIFPIPGAQIKKIACGDGFSLFLSKEGSVYSVGKDNKCQLGYELPFISSKLISGIKCQSVPTKIETFSQRKIFISDIYCGSDFSFAIDDTGNYYSWGCNSHGQLGRKGANDYEMLPEKANLLSEFEKPVKFVCGWTHAALLTNKGDIFIWGNPFYDYDNKMKDILIPGKLDIPYKCIDLSSGFHHLAMIAVNQDKFELYTFGINDFGQCGFNSENIFILKPQKVIFPESAPKTVLLVECGAFHTICKLGEKDLYGFGQNNYKQVGSYESDVIDYPSIINWDRETQKYLKKIICGNAFTYLIKTISQEENEKEELQEKEKYQKVHI